VNNFANHPFDKPFPVAISLSVLLHFGLLTLLASGNRPSFHHLEPSEVHLRLTRFSSAESLDTSSVFIERDKKVVNNDASTVSVSNSEKNLSDAELPSSTPNSSTTEISPPNPLEQPLLKGPKETETTFDPAQFSFGKMPSMPLGATGKGGWGIGALPEAAERLPPEAMAAQQLQMRISKQRKLVLGYLAKAQEALASRQPPTFCVIRFDTLWQKSLVKCEFAPDELFLHQLLTQGNIAHNMVALPADSPCTNLGNKKPPPDFECR
jgi:hypothetical protein